MLVGVRLGSTSRCLFSHIRMVWDFIPESCSNSLIEYLPMVSSIAVNNISKLKKLLRLLLN